MALEWISEQEIKEKIKTGKVLLNFSATWCGPCKMFAPVLDEINDEGKVKVFKVDIDKNRAAVKEYKVQGVPTTFFLFDGEIKGSASGFLAKEGLEKKIIEFLG